MQTLPAIVIGLYSRAAHAWGLLAGLLAGLASGLYMLYDTPNLVTGKEHFGGAQYALSNFGIDTKVTLYTGLIAIAVNLIVTFLVTVVVRMMGRADLPDQTSPEDYGVEAGDPGVEALDRRGGARRPDGRRFAPVYDTLADVYDWLVPEALLEPEGSAAAFEPVVGRAGRRRARARLRVWHRHAGGRAGAAGLRRERLRRERGDGGAHAGARGERTARAWRRACGAGRSSTAGPSTRSSASATRSRTRGIGRAALAAMRGVLRDGGLLAVTSRTWERPAGGRGGGASSGRPARARAPRLAPRRAARARGRGDLRGRRHDPRRAPRVLALHPRGAAGGSRSPPGSSRWRARSTRRSGATS